MIFPNGKNLVFVVSQPRSGSTMVQRVLAMNNEVATTAEPWIALRALNLLTRQKPIEGAEWDDRLAGDATNDFAETIGQAAVDDATRGYLTTLYGHAAGSARVFVDKTPRYYEILPELGRLFPESRIVLLVRHPLAVLISILTTWVKDDPAKLAHYKRDLLVAPGLILNARNTLPNAHVFHYESLVTTDGMQKLFDWLELDFSPGFMEYSKNAAPYGRMGDPNIGLHDRVVADSAVGWPERLRDPAYWRIACEYWSAIGPVADELGYSRYFWSEELRRMAPSKFPDRVYSL